MVIIVAMVISALGRLGVMAVYYQIVKYLTKGDNLLLPLSYGVLAEGISTRVLNNGVRVVYIDDPYADDDAFSFNLPVGYFNERDGDFPLGLSYLVANSLLNFQNEISKFEYNRSVVQEGESSTWGALSNDIGQGLKTFWHDFTTFSKNSSVAGEMESINFA